MSKILILSNGHGEDLSGSLIAKELIKNGHFVDALPIVGKGINYDKENIKVIGKTREFSTGGIGYNSIKGRFLEIFEGEIIYLLRKLYLSFKARKNYEFYVVVGDIVPVLFAWFAKKNFFTYLVAYSSHYEGRLKLPWPCKYFLNSHNSKKIYTRDLLTENDLTVQLKTKVSFLGNPFMDKFSSIDFKLDETFLSIGIFPGSRLPEIIDNLISILEVLEAMSALNYFKKVEFNFAIVNALDKFKIIKLLRKRDWKYSEKIFENNSMQFHFKFINISIKWNNFEEILVRSNLVISMAGTATEQAIGLAKPVIQIEGKGPQFTKSFAEAQRRLLGKYVFCATNYKNKKDQINKTIELILKVIYLIKIDNKFLSSCLENAKLRLGHSNACTKIVNDINDVMKNG